MNKKYAFVSIVLIALMSLTLFPTVSFAHHTPSSTDDSLYEPFGPRASQLLIKIYTDYTAELAGFINKEVDVMDWGLEPIDFQFFETNDPAHTQYSTAFYAEFGLFEYDVNDQVLPTSIISVRQAISHMLDKDFFINSYMAGTAIKADSPIASIPGWYNPAVTDLYNLAPRTTWPIPDDVPDWSAALALLVADLGSPIVDAENPAYLTWDWPSPFPTPSPDSAYPPVANGHLLVFARSEMAPRTQQGVYFKDACEIALPSMGVLLGFGPVRLKVDLYIVPRAVTDRQVKSYYRYHVYSGGWSLGRDPDFLMYYTTAMITKPAPWGPNYLMYSNPAYDAEVDLMVTSAIIGVPGNPCDGKYHAYLAQQILMGDAGIIPFWTFSGYKAYLANWRGVVNQLGFGANSWWTFLNAHKLGSEGGDVIRYGWAGDLLSMNVISSTWLWDWELLGKVYDSLIAVNPYNVGQDLPYLASGWELGTWLYGGTTTATKLTFHLREDVYWQDVPFKDRSAISYDGSNVLDGPFTNVPLTPVDVAFSIEYIRDLLDSWNGWLVGPVDHVGLNLGEWGSLWVPYDTIKPEWYTADVDYGIPWQYDYVQHDSTLATEDITIYLNVFMPWLALHWVGGIPIIPMHIWKWIPQNMALNVDTWLYDIVYGTGPWILLDRTAGISMTLIPFKTGQIYRDVTLERSYFYQPVRPPEHENDGKGINGMSVWFRNELTNYALIPLTVSVRFDYNLPGIPPGTLTQPLTIASGATAIVEEPHIATIPTSIMFDTPFMIHDDMHWAYVDPSPLVWQTFTGYLGDYDATPELPAYWSAVVDYHPGDIAGNTQSPPQGGYWHGPNLAADGIVNIGDVSIIGAHWQHKLPPLTPNSHAGTYFIDVNDVSGWCRRADITGDNIVNIGDVSIIGRDWQKKSTPPAYFKGIFSTVTFTGFAVSDVNNASIQQNFYVVFHSKTQGWYSRWVQNWYDISKANGNVYIKRGWTIETRTPTEWDYHSNYIDTDETTWIDIGSTPKSLWLVSRVTTDYKVYFCWIYVDKTGVVPLPKIRRVTGGDVGSSTREPWPNVDQMYISNTMINMVNHPNPPGAVNERGHKNTFPELVIVGKNIGHNPAWFYSGTKGSLKSQELMGNTWITYNPNIVLSSSTTQTAEWAVNLEWQVAGTFAFDNTYMNSGVGFP